MTNVDPEHLGVRRHGQRAHLLRPLAHQRARAQRVDDRHARRVLAGGGGRPLLVALAVSPGILLIVDGNLFVQSPVDVTTIFWNHDAVEKDPDAVRVEVPGAGLP